MIASARKAFTLIELLAVIVIVSLIAAVATVSLASADLNAGLLKAGASLREVDARARLHARTSGKSVFLKLDQEHYNSLMLFDAQQRQLSKVQLHQDVKVQFMSDVNIPRQLINFDRLGRSEDYQVIIESSATAQRISFSGLTGFAQLLQEPAHQ